MITIQVNKSNLVDKKKKERLSTVSDISQFTMLSEGTGEECDDLLEVTFFKKKDEDEINKGKKKNKKVFINT